VLVHHAADNGHRFTGMRLSARNQLQGTVVSVDLGSVMAIVVVRLAGGDEIVSAITKESAEDLDLREGDSVIAVIKATEVMVGKD
jgi:molybdopterin-binding protein